MKANFISSFVKLSMGRLIKVLTENTVKIIIRFFFFLLYVCLSFALDTHFNKSSVMIKSVSASFYLGRCYPVTLYLFQNPWQSHKPGLAHVTPLISLLFLFIQSSSKAPSLKSHQSFLLSIPTFLGLAVELCFPEVSLTVVNGIVPFVFSFPFFI